VFLRAPRATTVLVVRHADRVDGADALTQAGTTRAGVLRDVARNAGVTAIFVTDFVRVRETVRPLAEHLRIQPIVYGTPQEVAGTILSGHAGDVVLVAGHSNTVAAICESLLGQNLYTPDPDVEDFDNLFVVTRPVASPQGDVVNLQYGAATAPDVPNMSRSQITTFLLIRNAEGSGAALSTQGTARANALVDAMRKSGVSALFAPQGSLSAATLAPLSTALGQSVTSYDPADTAALVSQVQASHAGETVLVAGDNNTLRSLTRDLGAQPVPVIADEFDHLMVVTVLGAGDARVVNLQYGAPSP
jgi:phosphohistidine phosphatase SixA